MSLFTPTGTTVAINPNDVLLITDRVVDGVTLSSLYLSDKQIIPVDANPAALALEIDAAVGLVAPATMFTSGVVLADNASASIAVIAGQRVKSVAIVDGTQCSVTFNDLNATLITAVTSKAAMLALIADTSSGGGAGVIGGAWTPTLVGGTGNTPTLLSTATFLRSRPGAGAVVQVQYTIQVAVLDTNPVDVSVTGLPAVLDVGEGLNSPGSALVATGTVEEVIPSAVDDDTINYATTGAVTGNSTVILIYSASYIAAS